STSFGQRYQRLNFTLCRPDYWGPSFKRLSVPSPAAAMIALLLAARMASRNASWSWLRTAVTWSVMLPISSSDPSPHHTRFGGLLGWCGFAAELSYTRV